MNRVLFIDDNQTFLKLVKKTFGGSFDVVTASDGEAGLKAHQEDPPDVIVLDFHMPALKGDAVLETIRNEDEYTPVLVLTSEHRTSLLSKLLNMPRVEYLIKPVTTEQLRAALNNALDHAPTRTAPAVIAEAPLPDDDDIDDGGDAILLLDPQPQAVVKLRSFLPDNITVKHLKDPGDIVPWCRRRDFRAVLLDMTIPDLDSAAIASQVRVVNAETTVIGVFLRNVVTTGDKLKRLGLDSMLYKPFREAELEGFFSSHFEFEDVIITLNNIMRFVPFPDDKNQLGDHLSKVRGALRKTIEEIALASFEDLVLDMSYEPPMNSVGLIVTRVKECCDELSLDLWVVGSDEVQEALANYAETSDIPVCSTFRELKEVRKTAS